MAYTIRPYLHGLPTSRLQPMRTPGACKHGSREHQGMLFKRPAVGSLRETQRSTDTGSNGDPPGGNIGKKATSEQPEDRRGIGAQVKKWVDDNGSVFSLGAGVAASVLGVAQAVYKHWEESRTVRSEKHRKKKMENTLMSELFLQESLDKLGKQLTTKIDGLGTKKNGLGTQITGLTVASSVGFCGVLVVLLYRRP